MHFYMVLVLIALVVMAFVAANPFPAPNGEVIVIVNPRIPRPEDCYSTTAVW
ncbi:uncharacterized protein LOC108136083 [Drosophila elegans]|uniref:uncharacterized protein LOC108136083 n=1 Tax=Drosophila elegans TaxID=30023 RepID=UPI0007E7F5BD|nr:uncharacterized protein LOC108136083 [Drosophila elegans]